MDLSIVRHALAVPRGGTLPDPERALTEEGRARFSRSVRGLAAAGFRFERVLHSPWVRAAQTAELMAPLGGERIETELLARAPGLPLLRLVAKHGEEVERVALVGHEPWLSTLVGWLVAGEKHAIVEMKKGAVARLDGEAEPGGMVLRALLPPKVTRALR